MTNAKNYSKGLLSEILEFVMGNGMIPGARPSGQQCNLLCEVSQLHVHEQCTRRDTVPYVFQLFQSVGAIPGGCPAADGEIWKTRRRVIVPSLHRAYIAAMISMFGDCTLHATRVGLGFRADMGGAPAAPALLCSAIGWPCHFQRMTC
jgi:hypothetical protein